MTTNVSVGASLTMEATKKLLRVAIVGAPNAGKSTLLNRLVYSDISCVSNKVHTTRKNVLGVYTQEQTQLVFLDSPGLVTRTHLLKHHLEDSIYNDPEEASKKCDHIAVVVDASNLRDSKKLNGNILSLLKQHSDKTSFLILNKVDLVKDKRVLLDIGSRLTEWHIANRPALSEFEISRKLITLRDRSFKPTSPHVIDLDAKSVNQNNLDEDENQTPQNKLGYRNFSRVFSTSALQDEGIDELRDELMALAKLVDIWPHGPDYLTNNSVKNTVHSIIRGKVMDSVPKEIPYVIKYRYLQIGRDDLGSLHVDLELIAPKKYMVGKLLGKHGTVIFGIINESREMISRALACDVKLNIAVKASLEN